MAAASWRPSRARVLGLLVGGVAAVLLWWAQGDAGAPDGSGGSDRPSAGAGATDRGGLPLVRADELPAEARDVLRRIDAGGPFDFPEHDGGVFENREELLPDRPYGHYREYTVGGRPGDRGPLRIVAGADGERYWTDDHYRSFSRIQDTG